MLHWYEGDKQDQAVTDVTLLDDLDAMRRALAAGADVNARDAEHRETPLMLARSEAVRTPINHHADVHARNDRGEVALMYGNHRSTKARLALADAADGTIGAEALFGVPS